jgi:hypothetical protein
MVGSSDGEERRSGLLEKLVIVAIIVFLAAISAVLMSRLENRAKTRRAREDCKAWASAAERFKLKYGDYPSHLEMRVIALGIMERPGTPQGVPVFSRCLLFGF